MRKLRGVEGDADAFFASCVEHGPQPLPATAARSQIQDGEEGDTRRDEELWPRHRRDHGLGVHRGERRSMIEAFGNDHLGLRRQHGDRGEEGLPDARSSKADRPLVAGQHLDGGI